MADPLFRGPEVDLAAILEAREARVARRLRAQELLRQPTLALSLVFPGPVKLCPAAQRIADAARATLAERFDAHGWTITRHHDEDTLTGPEALFSIDIVPTTLKAEMVALEESHPLGRLWDLDVHDASGTALSRRDIGQPPRHCLLCNTPAHGCTRSRAHSLDELRVAISGLLGQAEGLAPASRGGKP
ncbi:citrate lyase holo-[acyl-carrier protein] synthase [Tropicimonas sp. TH_r6]|uniref:citrate lyase holo-[acyl-carrier protein] synthase n=1 Tax=Tropicimonas sp. TH_r6 TaxID=3082085 RepID=UPI002953DB49|nr:citrate lyase holo-[acyl-carrier protein] synthase [Tropicimonas sp. TH_r6]MDV7143176.1 citrate lyase holo-[acyl-carrier protein] synthase [Tropicimonas sp. TH_r6]